MSRALSPRVALVSCSNLPDWEVDDRSLITALEKLNIECFRPAWDDEDFDWSSCDLILPRTTWDYQERIADFLPWLERVAGESRLLNPLPLIRWNLDKRYLRDIERSGLISLPESIWLDMQPGDAPLPPLRSLCAERGWRRAFLKPVIGATAWGTLPFDALSEDGLSAAEEHLREWLPRRGMILQRYHEQVEAEGEFSLIFFEGRFSHGVQKIPRPGDYRVQDDHGATDHPWEPPGDWVTRCAELLEHLTPQPLYARCDFLRGTSGEPLLIELELIEPSLFFRHDSAAAGRFAASILQRLGAPPREDESIMGSVRLQALQ